MVSLSGFCIFTSKVNSSDTVTVELVMDVLAVLPV